MIFVDKPRTDAHIKRTAESDFQFIDRCSWPEMDNVRALLNGCVERYPASEQHDLVQRIMDRRNFRSAVFELLIHESLLRLGFDAQPHPVMVNGTKPDFLVTCPNGETFYLEAVLTTERGSYDDGAQARIDGAVNYLSTRPHPNFRAAIDYRGAPTTAPSGKALAKAIHAWFDCLDPDVIFDDVESGRAPPVLNWSHEDWQVRIRPIPVSVASRGTTTTLLGVQIPEARWRDAWSPMRDAVDYKGTKYGEPDRPLLVATNSDSVFLHQIDEVQALFGQEQFVISADAPDAEPRLQRAGNGAWVGTSGPRGLWVSGVWSFKGLHAYNVATCKQSIYLHPWANRPLPSDMLRFPHFKLRGEHLESVEGVGLKEIFGLHDDWPNAPK